MSNFWMNFAVEIGFLSLLGVLYYFYQKKRIIRQEENKPFMIINFILQSCLAEKTELPQPELDSLIIAMDDFLNNKTSHPPLDSLKSFTQSPSCSSDLKAAILEGLKELEQ
jgi:hypothetical protein